MYTIYQLVGGDTLEKVANKFNTDVETLIKLNNINNDMIYPGLNIVVPKRSTYLKEYIVKEGDTIYSIARKNNTDVDTLLKLNGLNEYDYIYPNEQILIPMENIGIYITKENDSINYVINNLGIDANTLTKNNEKILLIPDQLIIYKKEKKL